MRPVQFILTKMVLLIAAVFSALPVAAQTSEGDPSSIIAVPLKPTEKISLDGTLSDPVWQRAPVYRDFVEKAPTVGATPGHETLVQMVHDDKAVYIGITALDPQPEQIRAPLVRHDGVIRTQDFVVVYLDPIGKRQSAQFFRVNAAGSTADGMHTASDDSEDFSPDFDFDAAARRNENGYTAVLRIPFASLRFSNDTREGWRMMVARRVPRAQFYLHTSVLIPNEASSFIAKMQPLAGITLPEDAAFLNVRPSITLRQQRTSSTEIASQRDTMLRGSLDLKWRPLPELVVDATVRPDFSQIDLDVPQLGGNSRYALFFPEKRPFFFEASDLLKSPTDALYTRSFTEPGSGIRATWRDDAFAGTAMIVDDRGGGLTLLPGTYRTSYADQPASLTLALRGLGSAGALQAGGTLAARRYDGGRGENLVAGPDLDWRMNEQIRLRAQWLRSHTTAQPDGLGDLQQRTGTDGDQLYFETVYRTERIQSDITFQDIDGQFRNDSGFVNQVGVRIMEAHHGINWQQIGPFNELWLNLNVNHTRDRVTSQTVKTEFVPNVWFSAPGNTQATIAIHGLSLLRTGSQAPLLRERFLRAEYSVTPARWIPLVESSLSVGRMADVVANEVRPGLRASLMVRMRVLPQFELEPNLSVARLSHDGKQAYREMAAQLKGIWFFNAASNLRVIAQQMLLDRRAEPGVAELHDKRTVASITYAWRRSAGTTLYVGASHARDGDAAVSRSSEAFVKLQFDTDNVKQLF